MGAARGGGAYGNNGSGFFPSMNIPATRSISAFSLNVSEHSATRHFPLLAWTAIVNPAAFIFHDLSGVECGIIMVFLFIDLTHFAFIYT